MDRSTADIANEWRDCYRFVLGAFHDEAQHRADRTVEEWVRAEKEAVLKAANLWAAEHQTGRPLTLDEVAECEQSALGHIDYAKKWAFNIANRMYRGETP